MSVLGVDLSTQSCTVEVRCSKTFELLGTARSLLPTTYPPVSEHDPELWWVALKECLGQVRNLDQVEAISIGGQCHGLVPLDSDGSVIRPAKLWNDTVSWEHAEKLVKKIGREEWARLIGSVPTAAFTISKLSWLIENEPENVSRIKRILLPHDYLTWRLTGKFTTERTEASGTGYFSSSTGKYLYELLQECFGDTLVWKDVFPEVLKPAESAGGILQQAATELGLVTGIPVGPGGGDQHLAAVGLGLNEGDVAVSLGTSGVVLAVSPKPVIDPEGVVDGVASATGGWLPLVCTLNCTKVTDRMAQWLGVSVEALGDLALTVNPTAPRPVFVGYLDGERTPPLPNAQGLLNGLTGSTTREQLALSAFEGVVLGLHRGFEAIVNMGVPTGNRLIVIGGGAKSAAYRQIIADIFDRSVLRVDAPEATARGACLQALAVLSQQPIESVQAKFQPPIVDITGRREIGGWNGLEKAYFQAADFVAGQKASSDKEAQQV